jgi:hypothetical protein
MIMKARLETKHPRIRCQQCGDARVIAVCHHCGAALCAEHGRETAGRVGLSVEFTGLDLDPGRGAHCGRCAHTLTEPMSLAPVLGLVIGGVVVGGAGLSLGAAVVGLGGLLLLAGGVAALMRSQQWQHLKARRPEFPALPQLRSFEVRETLRARQELQADGRSTVAVLEATGRASVLATLTDMDRTRLAKFRRKYRLDEAGNLPVCAGFVGFDPAVSGPAGDTAGGGFTTLLPLRSTVAELPYLGGNPNPAAAEWRQEVQYAVGLPASGGGAPLRIVPSLVHDRAKRDLQVELSWLGHGDAPVPTVDEIELLELRYPAGLGLVTCRDGWEADRDPVIDAQGEAWLTVRLVRPPVQPAETEAEDLPPGSRRFYFQFENPVPPGQVFRGRAIVLLQGALSGLERAALFTPLGVRRDQVPAEITTRFELEFGLSTTPLLYSVLKLMPGGETAAAAAPATPKVATQVFEGVPASPELVIALTAALGRSGFYVKSVTEENPKQQHRGGGQLRHRTWDLLGRRYHGVHPTDFHLVLQGEESPAPRRARLTVSLNAQGSHADQDAGHRIGDDWQEVFEVLRATVADLPVVEETAPAAKAAPVETARPPVVPAGGLAAPAPPPSAARDRLVKAYVEGVVPEKLFRELLAGLEGASGSATSINP